MSRDDPPGGTLGPPDPIESFPDVTVPAAQVPAADRVDPRPRDVDDVVIDSSGIGDHPPTPVSAGGPLLVTPAGGTLVATDAMHAHLEQLSSVEQRLRDAVRALARAEAEAVRVPATTPGIAAAHHASAELATALAHCRLAHETATRTAHALRRAITGYDDAERAALRRADVQIAMLGAEFGPLLGLALPGILFGTGAVWLASKVPDPGGRRASLLKGFLLDHPEWITGPRFVETVRLFTSGLDETASSMAGIPAPVAFLMGLSGVTGVRTSARGMLAIGPWLGIFRETPVKVERVATERIPDPAVGTVQRLARVPEVNQVRVEKYTAPGARARFVVYVGPTETFSPTDAKQEPWDLTSNVGGVGGLDVAAFRASELAMHDAGVAPGDQVQLVGFSQGGLVATMLASSGNWNVQGLQTFGGPAGNIALPSGIDGMAIRNTDDFIPMLAGPQLDHHLVQVERQAFADGAVLPTYHAAPAHQRDAYMATAAAVDAATSSTVRDQTAALDSFTGDYASRPGSTITVMNYHAERITHPAPPLDPKEVLMGAGGSSARAR